MAVTAKFAADFSDFYAAVDKADKSLVEFSSTAEHTQKSLNDVSDASEDVGGKMSGAAKSIKEVDNVLDLVGIRTGPVRKALDDLGNAAEAGEGKLSNLAKGGLVVSAAIGGWEIGRWIAETLKFDEAIGNLAAKVLGFGDVAAEKAAVAADALARASKEVGFQVNDLSTAMIINTEKAKEAEAANKKFADALARNEAPKKAAEDLQRWSDELAQIKKQGLLDSLAKDINTHAFSMATLADRYRISTEAISLFTKEAQHQADVEESNIKKLDKLQTDWERAKRERAEKDAKAAEDAITQRDKNTDDWIESQKKIIKAENEKRDAVAAAEKVVVDKVKETTAWLDAQRKAAQDLADALSNVTEYNLSTQSGFNQFKRQNPTATISGTLTPEYFMTHTLEDAIREGLITMFNAFRIPGFSGGSQNVGAERVAPDLTPPFGGNGAIPFVGASPIFNITINGVVGTDMGRQLATLVGDELMRNLRIGRQYPSA